MIEALLGEYRLVVEDLKTNPRGVSARELVRVADASTSNPDCVSIQSVLAHVVYCGHNHLFMIERHRGNAKYPKPRREPLGSVAAYGGALDEMLVATEASFERLSDALMARNDPAKKMRASWGQLYDIEQLMEHAIVHVSRHRRQIVNFRRDRSRSR
jgi:uncharacterized damage-inducible protein DinB